MIRKYVRVDVRPETMRDLFREVEQWPDWMPSIESLDVLERSADRAVVRVRQRLAGRVSTQKLANPGALASAGLPMRSAL